MNVAIPMTVLFLGFPLLLAVVGVVLAIPKSTRTAGFVLLGLATAGVVLGAALVAIYVSRSNL